MLFISLPNNKILDLSKLKAFADDKMKVAGKFIIGFGTGKKHFWEMEKLLVTKMFSKTGLCG